MSSQSLKGVKEIIDDLDFNLAFRRIKHDAQHDFLQLPIEISIFENFLEDNIKFLKDAIKQDTFTIKSLRKIWVPKRGFFLRPGAIPHVEDRLLFQALIDNIAPLLEAQLPPMDEQAVFSSRLHPNHRNENMFRHPRDLWLAFKKKAVEYCDLPEVHHVMSSDIASYFENIDLRLLNDTLVSSSVNPTYTEAVRQILSTWANGRTRGLPQMMAPCTLLSNAYLSQVDRSMLLHGYKYVRYVDDIRIFVSSDVEQRKALLDLTEYLKNLYLDVQSSKTKFETSEEHKNEITSLENTLIKSGINVNEEASMSYFGGPELNQKIPEAKLIEFLNALLENPHYDDRHLRFCVNNLALIKSPAARNLVISKLYSMPQETETFVKYLLQLPQDVMDEESIELVLQFLESQYNIYDWQMMWLLILLLKCKLNQNHTRRLFRMEKLQILPVNRGMLYYLLCSKGDATIQRIFMARYGQEQYKEVKMAILCGIWMMEKKERNRFYALAGGDRQLDQLIEILKNKQVEFC
jgi:retron-type reverse transcriptase